MGEETEIENDFIMICPKALDNNGDQNANTSGVERTPFQLRHPRTNKSAMFICTTDAVYEVNHFKPKTSCWFIGGTVRSDGTLLVVTPLDPLFLLLPYLTHASQSSGGKNFMLLDQTLVDDDYDAVGKRLLPVFASEPSSSQLRQVADVKSIDDSDCPAVRYNEAKTLAWLDRKVRNLAEALKAKDVDIHGSRSASLVIPHDSSEGDRTDSAKEEISADLLRYAHDVVGEYLSYSLKTKLAKHLRIVDAVVKESSSDVAPPVAKKAKMGAGAEEPAEDYTKAATPFSPVAANKKSATKAAKDLAKASKGTTSVMSFFKAKPKN